MKIRVLDCATLRNKGNCCCYFKFVYEATYLRPQYKQIAILQVTKWVRDNWFLLLVPSLGGAFDTHCCSHYSALYQQYWDCLCYRWGMNKKLTSKCPFWIAVVLDLKTIFSLVCPIEGHPLLSKTCQRLVERQNKVHFLSAFYNRQLWPCLIIQKQGWSTRIIRNQVVLSLYYQPMSLFFRRPHGTSCFAAKLCVFIKANLGNGLYS